MEVLSKWSKRVITYLIGAIIVIFMLMNLFGLVFIILLWLADPI